MTFPPRQLYALNNFNKNNLKCKICSKMVGRSVTRLGEISQLGKKNFFNEDKYLVPFCLCNL
jgi:hypothetical protein